MQRRSKNGWQWQLPWNWNFNWFCKASETTFGNQIPRLHAERVNFFWKKESIFMCMYDFYSIVLKMLHAARQWETLNCKSWGFEVCSEHIENLEFRHQRTGKHKRK